MRFGLFFVIGGPWMPHRCRKLISKRLACHGITSGPAWNAWLSAEVIQFDCSLVSLRAKSLKYSVTVSLPVTVTVSDTVTVTGTRYLFWQHILKENGQSIPTHIVTVTVIQ